MASNVRERGASRYTSSDTRNSRAYSKAMLYVFMKYDQPFFNCVNYNETEEMKNVITAMVVILKYKCNFLQPLSSTPWTYKGRGDETPRFLLRWMLEVKF
jgi:hypothetical protein